MQQRAAKNPHYTMVTMTNKSTAIDVQQARRQFPALSRTGASHRPCLFFDAPGGTQVPSSVIEAMSDYLRRSNANTHGQFRTSRETDAIIDGARQAAADLLGTPAPESIHFGANMTSITYRLSQALARRFAPGDEIIVTRLDHDANVAPWLALQRQGIVIKWLDFDPATCTLKLDALPDLISERTRLIAAGYASNAVGTINDVAAIVRLARDHNCLTYIDAVHFAPHGLIDVAQLGCDVLVCSAYKFFGPHVGVAYLQPTLANALSIDKVRPQSDAAPYKFETGTLNHEGLAGLAAAVDYLANLVPAPAIASRRERIRAVMTAIAAYERKLSRRLVEGLQQVVGLHIYGITSADRLAERTPTVSVAMDQMTAAELAHHLGEQDIFVWDGDFYAVEVIRRLGLEARGGLVRIGLAHYNTPEEIDLLLEAMPRP